jgi:hypothetical protein
MAFFQKKEEQKKSPPLGELGSSGTQFFSGIIKSDDYNTDLTGSKGREEFDKMRLGDSQVAGVLLAAYLSHFRGKGLQAINGAVIFGVTLILFAMSNWFPLSLIAAFALGMAGQFYMTTIHAIMQMNLPNELRGRVMGLHGLAWELMRSAA